MPSVEFRLYLVSDRGQTGGRPLTDLIALASRAGLPAVQVRERDLPTRQLAALIRTIRTAVAGLPTRVLVNDRADLALALGADGVHLRANSLPTGRVRTMIGPEHLLSVSTHSREEVRRAQDEGADFVVFGPVYETPSKQIYGRPQGLGMLAQVCEIARVPVFAIGGVTPERVAEVRQVGAHGVAVVSSILSAPDVPAAVRQFLQAWQDDRVPWKA
ncbi:MAG: thiamine phosphate synthase [Nitrospiraceae bacterium]